FGIEVARQAKYRAGDMLRLDTIDSDHERQELPRRSKNVLPRVSIRRRRPSHASAQHDYLFALSAARRLCFSISFLPRRRVMLKHNLPILAIAAIASFCGCGSDPLGRRAISGTVNVDGAPLEKGQIRFQPIEKQATSEGAVVTGGKFSVPREHGLVPGKYR